MNTPANPLVFNRKQLNRRRQRARASYESVDFLKKRVAEDIEDRISVTRRQFDLAVELGAGLSDLREVLAPHTGTMVLCDSSPALASTLTPPALCVDEEWLPFKQESLDLIVSSLALHWVNDLPGTLIQIRRSLKPDGFFVGAMLGGASLMELRQALLQAETELTGGAEMRVSPFADALDMSQLLQRAGFTLPVSDRDRLTLRYDNIFALFRDLQASGETHAPFSLTRKPLTRRVLMRAADIYQEQFADPDGRIRATIDIVWMTGWAPHPDQPKAKRPGSATVRLADALGVEEQSTGEKAG